MNGRHRRAYLFDGNVAHGKVFGAAALATGAGLIPGLKRNVAGAIRPRIDRTGRPEKRNARRTHSGCNVHRASVAANVHFRDGQQRARRALRDLQASGPGWRQVRDDRMTAGYETAGCELSVNIDGVSQVSRHGER